MQVAQVEQALAQQELEGFLVVRVELVQAPMLLQTLLVLLLVVQVLVELVVGRNHMVEVE
jgi:hypothetical protein